MISPKDEYRCTYSISHLGKLSSQEISVQTKACLWNSFILVAQRCSEKERHLDAFARATLPWVVEWILNASMTDDAVPLTGALQVVFIVLTRLKSASCFEGQSTPRQATMKMIYEKSLEILNTVNASGGNALHLTALKVILALATIDSIDTQSAALVGCHLQAVYQVIGELAKNNSDSEVTSLATKILRVFKNNEVVM